MEYTFIYTRMGFHMAVYIFTSCSKEYQHYSINTY